MKILSTFRFFAFILSFPALLLAGCSSDEESIEAWMSHESQKMKGSIKPIPEVKSVETVSYSIDSGIDPFSPARIVPRRVGGQDEPTRHTREPLEAYPLESLQMVGAIIKPKERVALIRVDKSLFQVRVGNYMGQNNGLVKTISETEVVLREMVENLEGNWDERLVTLHLNEQEAKK